MYIFKPGDRVVCINNNLLFPDRFETLNLTIEKTYTVVDVLCNGVLVSSDRCQTEFFISDRFKASYETMCADIGIE